MSRVMRMHCMGKGCTKVQPLLEGLAAHQLVGRVTAYQGDDG